MFQKYKFFRSMRYLDRDNYQKEIIFEFFIRFLGDLVPLLKVNHEYLKNKNLIFHLPKKSKKNIQK
jgi:hypothetical protein